jgi:hypothetical protein
MKIYLDDNRTPLDDSWIVVRDYEQFVKTIISIGDLSSIEIISFDHDLGITAIDEYFKNVIPNYNLDYDNITELTGYDCIKWLINYYYETNPDRLEMERKDKKVLPLGFPLVRVHSANPIGGANIIGYANNFYKNEGKEMASHYLKVEHTI